MLTFLRRHSKSLLIKVLLIAVALSFIIGFGTSYIFSTIARSRGMATNIVAQVGDVAISREDFLKKCMKLPIPSDWNIGIIISLQ